MASGWGPTTPLHRSCSLTQCNCGRPLSMDPGTAPAEARTAAGWQQTAEKNVNNLPNRNLHPRQLILLRLYQCRMHVEGKSSSLSLIPGCYFLSLFRAKGRAGRRAGWGAATRSHSRHASCRCLFWQDVIAESWAVIVRRWAFLSSLKGLCPFSGTIPPFPLSTSTLRERGPGATPGGA